MHGSFPLAPCSGFLDLQQFLAASKCSIEFPPAPPSVKRMNSAPAAMTGVKHPDSGVRFINVKPSYPTAKIKESLKNLETLHVSSIKPKPISRIETEV